MNTSISTIIPFYNCGNSLSKMLDSILNGTVLPTEIILIDDGSTDNSADIAKEYARNNSIIQLMHQQHKGVSAARNLGLLHANCSWISFVDADDYIESNMYESLVSAITEDIDGIICGKKKKKDNISTAYSGSSSRLYNSQELLKSMFVDDNIRGFLFNRLFRADILQNTEFNENISLCEDLLFQSELLTNNPALKFSYIGAPLYHYVQNEFNTTGTLNFFENNVFKYKPAFDILQRMVGEQFVVDSYDSILTHSMYSLLKIYKSVNKSVIPQIRLLQNELKYVKPSALSKRRMAYQYMPLLFSHFLE